MDSQPTLTLSRVNTPPAQTWNYLRSNDITLTVPAPSRKGDVYFALPRLFEGVACGMGEDVTSWVASVAKDARYVEVRANERREEPIIIDTTDAWALDTGIMVRAGAEATVCVIAATAEPATTAAVVRIVCERGARLHLFEVACANAGHTHLESVGISCDDDVLVDVRQFFLGAGTCATGLACSLGGERSRIDLTCRYLARENDILDINHVVRCQGARSRADMVESGVLDGAAKKALRATIDLVHGAKGAQGSELESVLVLSDDVTNKTMPVILCDEDDVVGNHGATIGSVGPDQLRYLEDRGLARDEAEALYVRALFDEAAILAPAPAATQAILARAREVLGADTADEIVDALDLLATDGED